MVESGLEVSDLFQHRPWWRRWRVVTSVILMGMIGGLAYWGFIRDTSTAAPSTTQQVAVTLGSLSTMLTASGTAAAEQTTTLMFPTAGTVTAVLVQLGQQVSARQPLARLDDREAQRKVETAEANYVQAQLRMTQLLQPSAVDRASSQQSLVSARTQLENAQVAYAALSDPPEATAVTVAENAVASAEATLRSSQNTVENSRASLYQAQNNYCSLAFEVTFAVCTPDKLPISADVVTSLQTSIARNATVPTQALMSAVNSLISANSSHTNALSSRETATISDATARANLAALHDSPTAEKYRVAWAAVQNAEASYASAQARAEALTNPGALDLSLQQQAVRSADVARQEAQDALDDTTLIAPFAGRIGAVTATVGERIGANAAAVVLSNPDSIRMDLTIAETDLVSVRAGMLGVARFDSLPLNLYVIRVMGVSPMPTVTQGVVTYPVQAEILRGAALTNLREELPALMGALGGTAGAQFSARFGGAGATGATGADGALRQRPPGAGGATGAAGPDGTARQRPSGAGAGADAGAGGGGGTGRGTGRTRGGGGTNEALFNPPLPAAGMNASITLLVSVTTDQLLVPSGAVRRQGGQNFVYVPGEGDAPPVQKPVVVAGTDGTNTAIATGVAEGDVVLLGAIASATPVATQATGGGGRIGGGGGGGIR